MAFSSDFGFFIPCDNDDEIKRIVVELVDIIDKFPNIEKQQVIRDTVRKIIKVKKYLIFNKSKIEITNIEYKRGDPEFKNFIKKKILNGNHVSIWKVAKEFSSIMLNGEAEIQNSKLWTPEDISISWGIEEIDFGDEAKELKGVKIYIWGYGYFFPYSMDETIDKIISSDLVKLLYNAISDIVVKVKFDVDVIGETSLIKSINGFKFPIIVQQSL